MGSGGGDISFSFCNLIFKSLNETIMLVFLPVKILGVDVLFELIISEEVLESLD